MQRVLAVLQAEHNIGMSSPHQRDRNYSGRYGWRNEEKEEEEEEEEKREYDPLLSKSTNYTVLVFDIHHLKGPFWSVLVAQ